MIVYVVWRGTTESQKQEWGKTHPDQKYCKGCGRSVLDLFYFLVVMYYLEVLNCPHNHNAFRWTFSCENLKELTFVWPDPTSYKSLRTDFSVPRGDMSPHNVTDEPGPPKHTEQAVNTEAGNWTSVLLKCICGLFFDQRVPDFNHNVACF